MRTRHGSATRKHVAQKRPRHALATAQSASPPTQQITMVASRPPSELLAPSPPLQLQSPQLPDQGTMTPAHQSDVMEETYVLNLQPVDPTTPSMPPMAGSPPPTTPQPQLSTATPPAQNTLQAFCDSWTTQQPQHLEYLRRHTQLLSSIPHYLPRISCTMGVIPS
ncbi:mucin-7-like [Pseudophryne corroboree]|uniref:mucin-7-like n=1 Tax=Pseudophryne corroboree TaxID=495146 RepID=UPI00308163C9